MMKLIREFLVIAMLGVVTTGAFAQRKDRDKRPPKEKVIVVTNSNKGNRPPPPPRDRDKPRPDKRGRP